jgi:hypothetical protein
MSDDDRGNKGSGQSTDWGCPLTLLAAALCIAAAGATFVGYCAVISEACLTTACVEAKHCGGNASGE